LDSALLERAAGRPRPTPSWSWAAVLSLLLSVALPAAGSIAAAVAASTPAGATDLAGSSRLNLDRVLADTSTDGVTPAGTTDSGPLEAPYATAANTIDADVSPAYDTGNTTTTFSTLVRNTAAAAVYKKIKITLPAGYTNISVAFSPLVASNAFSSGTWGAPAVDQTNRTVQTALIAGSGLAPGSGWARIDVTATTPASLTGNADQWRFDAWTDTAGTAGNAKAVTAVLVNGAGSGTTAALA
jgi:hypothetical protein